MARKQAVGSNQYKTKVGETPISAVDDLMIQAGALARRRCGPNEHE